MLRAQAEWRLSLEVAGCSKRPSLSRLLPENCQHPSQRDCRSLGYAEQFAAPRRIRRKCNAVVFLANFRKAWLILTIARQGRKYFLLNHRVVLLLQNLREKFLPLLRLAQLARQSLCAKARLLHLAEFFRPQKGPLSQNVRRWRFLRQQPSLRLQLASQFHAQWAERPERQDS
ncbi:MAG: hypothetical protein EBZ05_06720 [Verrucomicrobia bacterium]|nr:hypothetical protein [Verrucomicrobiota bacterium]